MFDNLQCDNVILISLIFDVVSPLLVLCDLI